MPSAENPVRDWTVYALVATPGAFNSPPTFMFVHDSDPDDYEQLPHPKLWYRSVN